MDEPSRCTGPDSFGSTLEVMTRSSWLRTSHFAPPDAPGIVPMRSSEKPRALTSLNAAGPAKKRNVLLVNYSIPNTSGAPMMRKLAPLARTKRDVACVGLMEPLLMCAILTGNRTFQSPGH